MFVHDVGLTFGKAYAFNENKMAMNLAEWAATPHRGTETPRIHWVFCLGIAVCRAQMEVSFGCRCSDSSRRSRCWLLFVNGDALDGLRDENRPGCARARPRAGKDARVNTWFRVPAQSRQRCPRDAALCGRRQMPEDRCGDDVSELYGDAGGEAFDARPRAAGGVRSNSRSRHPEAPRKRTRRSRREMGNGVPLRKKIVR